MKQIELVSTSNARWMIQHDLTAEGKAVGSLSVSYMEEPATKAPDLYMKTERLISQIVETQIQSLISEYYLGKKEIPLYHELLESKAEPVTDMTEKIEHEKNVLREKISVNIGRNVLPILQKLMDEIDKGQIPAQYKNDLEMIHKSLDDLDSDFYQQMESVKFGLTPSEIRITHMIKIGHSMSEISKKLGISFQTTKVHMKNIRRKLGLTNKSITLKRFLNTIEGSRSYF